MDLESPLPIGCYAAHTHITGSDSEVYIAHRLKSSKNVVVKVYSDPKYAENTYDILTCLAGCSHSNICSVLDRFQTKDNQLCLVFPFYKGKAGVLPCSSEHFFHYFKRLLGVHDCHRNNIVHTDICPRNVLYSEKTKCLTLIDFDMAYFVSRGDHVLSRRSLCRDILNTPPEADRAATTGFAVDAWAVGVMMLMALTRCDNDPCKQLDVRLQQLRYIKAIFNAVLIVHGS